MTTEITAGGLGEGRTVSTAGGGTALTTTAAFLRLPLGTRHLQLTPRNFSTAVVAKYHLNPWLTIFKSTDAMATAPTNYSKQGQDFLAAAAGVVFSSLATLANLGLVLVGSEIPFRGVACTINAANGNASVLSVHYWNGAWTTATPTDGTTTGGKTFGQSGNVTWTVPTDWTIAKLSDIYTSAPSFLEYGKPMYWTRWTVSAALDASTTLDQMLAMNRDTAQYNELMSGQPFEEIVIHGEPQGIGNIEALTDAGTGNLIVNAFAARGGKFA